MLSVLCFTSNWLLLLLITNACFSPCTASFGLRTSLATGSCWTLWTKKIRSLASLLTWLSPTATIKYRYFILNSFLCKLPSHFQQRKANGPLCVHCVVCRTCQSRWCFWRSTRRGTKSQVTRQSWASNALCTASCGTTPKMVQRQRSNKSTSSVKGLLLNVAHPVQLTLRSATSSGLKRKPKHQAAIEKNDSDLFLDQFIIMILSRVEFVH